MAGSTGSIDIVRHYEAAPETVWQAWTDPQALSRWFGPGEARPLTKVELDVRPGGRYTIAFSTPDGEEHQVSGEYVQVEPPRKLSFSWAWKSTPDRVSFITVELQAGPGWTTMRFRHERFFDEAARDNHRGGWTATFARLDTLLGRRPG